MSFYSLSYTIESLIFLGLLAVKMWALVDAILRPAQAYLAAGKLTKQGWLWILGLAFATQVFPLGIMVYLIGTVAAFVYLLDVKPALGELTRRR